jgi:uncharacterized surface protein with fasciclin (FAS1) repeats
MKTIFKTLALIVLSATIVSCSNDDDSNQQTIAEIASGNSDFSTLVTALNRTGLTATLDGSGQFTVFAPTNAAFQAFFTSLGPSVNVNNVDVNVLRNVLLNHVIGEEIKNANIVTGYESTLSPFNSATNSPTISMYIQKTNGVVTLNGGASNGGATVATADLDASNGVIHVVNNVIGIPTVKDHAVANPDFSTLTSLLVAQNLAATLDGTASSPFTVFAPLNASFDTATLNLYTGLTTEQKTAVLLYHVVGGANVRSNAIPTTPITTLETGTFTIAGTVITDESNRQTNIVLTDVQCSNGVVHAINKVLLPTL